MIQRIAPVPLLAAFFVTGGCSPQKLNDERNLTVEPLSARQVDIDAPKAQQGIRVQVTASEPVNVDIALNTKATDIMNKLQADKRPAAGDVLASKEKTKSDTLEATIPAGQSFSVFVSGATKKSDVKLKITSQ